MKRALVLSGGGARGAYQIGAWQALNEAGMRFQGVYGTSIGAINALLFAQGDLEGAIQVWDSITAEVVTGIPEKDYVAIDRMINRKRDVVPFLLEHANQLLLDMKPLEKLLRAEVDEKRVRDARLALGLMTVRFPSLGLCPVRLKDIPEGRLIDYALASATCFPVFTPRYIDGERYIDGGYADNMPVDMALRDGAQEIVAVDLHPKPTHPEYMRMPFVTAVMPRKELGGFLDFDADRLRRSRWLGYYDAMKRLGQLEGIRYAFRRSAAAHVQRAVRSFVQDVAGFDARAIARASLNTQPPVAPLISALEKETPGQALSWKEVYLRGLELAAECAGCDELHTYDAEALTAELLQRVHAAAPLPAMTEKALQALAKADPFALVTYFYQQLRLRAEGLDPAFIRLAAAHPQATAAAIFLAGAE